MIWQWLSFANADLPEGQQFLGAIIVPAELLDVAIMLTWAHKILSQAFDPEKLSRPMPEGWTMRLLSRADCEAFDAYMEDKHFGISTDQACKIVLRNR